jgi:hypothetical protein
MPKELQGINSMSASTSITALYDRLADAGVNKTFVKKVLLPSWWDESIAESQPGFAYTLAVLSARLGIPIKALADHSKSIELPSTASARFKHNQNIDRTEIAWANSIAIAAARHVLQVTKSPLKKIPAEPKAIRQAILDRGNTCVTLAALLTYLWDHGVPVIHTCAKPAGQKAMTGLATRSDGRPVIVCCKNLTLPPLMSFVVAHELGHIVKHLKEDGSFLDEKVDLDSIDQEEKEANAFAAVLLTGRTTVYETGGTGNITAPRLAKFANAAGRRDGVDPGVVAMSVAHGRGFYPIGIAACKLTDGESLDACDLIRSTMAANINLHELPDEDQDFVRKACGCGESHALPVGY